ncbi:hypothetical protein J5N97_024878 [Dioscorea zingiberensis]|uniref:Uncharacterized protein n=1 Tax=Dioscorea zingiberensis TaxID=325984 RepID=A0A9D5C788_9LILI|nr:hypothetical protein J5N97_024878 [Dioscorea zingiberensis]
MSLSGQAARRVHRVCLRSRNAPPPEKQSERRIPAHLSLSSPGLGKRWRDLREERWHGFPIFQDDGRGRERRRRAH